MISESDSTLNPKNTVVGVKRVDADNDLVVRTFEPALQDLTNRSVFGPVAFQKYVSQHRLGDRKTAPSISIDSLEKLPPELQNADAMVIRLGSPKGSRGTDFAIIRVDGHLEEFFLIHDTVFGDCVRTPFLPVASWRDLYAFQVLRRLTESSLVNLAIASGLLGYALDLDEDTVGLVPATGQSTFTFQFQPHDLVRQTLFHQNGQVEIDALFVGRRNRKDCLFVVEAKSGPDVKSIAKHKLVYPVLSVAKHLPTGMLIVPVYIHVTSEADGYHFRIAECEFHDPRTRTPVLSSLAPIKTSHLVFHMLPEGPVCG